MGWVVPEARRQCYNSPMNSDLSGTTRTTRTIAKMPFLGRTLCRGPTKTFHACNISLCRNVLILTLPVWHQETPPFPLVYVFWMHKINLWWECAAKYPHHPSKISASSYNKMNKTTEQRSIQSYSSWMKTVNQSPMSSRSGEQNKTKEEEWQGNSIGPSASAIIRESHTPTIIRGTRTQRGNRGSSLIRRGRRQNKRWRRGTKQTRQQAGRALWIGVRMHNKSLGLLIILCKVTKPHLLNQTKITR